MMFFVQLNCNPFKNEFCHFRSERIKQFSKLKEQLSSAEQNYSEQELWKVNYQNLG